MENTENKAEFENAKKTFPYIDFFESGTEFSWGDDFRQKFRVGKEAASVMEAAKMANVYVSAGKFKLKSFSQSLKNLGTC